MAQPRSVSSPAQGGGSGRSQQSLVCSMLRQLALSHHPATSLPVPAFFSLALCATLPWPSAQRPDRERPDRGTQLHETEHALVTQPRQGPALSQEPEILGGICPAGETGVLGYGDAFVRHRRRLVRRKASRLRCRPCGNRFRVIELTCRLCCVHVRAHPLRVSPYCAALWNY